MQMNFNLMLLHFQQFILKQRWSFQETSCYVNYLSSISSSSSLLLFDLNVDPKRSFRYDIPGRISWYSCRHQSTNVLWPFKSIKMSRWHCCWRIRSVMESWAATLLFRRVTVEIARRAEPSNRHCCYSRRSTLISVISHFIFLFPQQMSCIS